jgi:hypothetical protein
MGFLGDLLGIGKPYRSLDSYVQENINAKRGYARGGMILKGPPQMGISLLKDTVALRKGGLVKGSKQAKAYMAKIRAMKKK